MKRVEVFRGFWTCEDCERMPHALFVFGDNDLGRGWKGQAVIRRCANAAGVPTKKLPSMAPDAFYTDAEFEANCARIDAALDAIMWRFFGNSAFEVLMLPEAGLGTGLARLDVCAPRTFAYLKDRVAKLSDLVADVRAQSE